MIDGVEVLPLRQYVDERGKLLHMLRSDAPNFPGFGEIYFSLVNPGAVKAWHLQKKMVRHYAVPVGAIKVVLFDARDASPSFGAVQEVFLGEDNYRLLVIPPDIWSGFMGVSTYPALVADCTSLPHDPDQASRRDPSDPEIPYRWDSPSR